MPTKVKIRIYDANDLRVLLDTIYEEKSQVELAKWALNLAERMLKIVGYEFENNTIIQNGFATNRQWQAGIARMHDVRRAGFKVHKIAKECENPVKQAALRVAGQAIGTGHMREHAMVASDYAIKVINLMYPNNMKAVRFERDLQITSLKLITP